MKRMLALALILFLLPLAAIAEGTGTTPLLPLPNQFGSSQMIDFSLSPEGTEAYVYYSPATADDLDQYLTLCAMAGTYAYDTANDKAPTYRLLVPGTNYSGLVLFDADKELIMILTPAEGVGVMRDADLEGIYNALSADLRLPADATGTVFPQFYACVGSMPKNQTTTSRESIFDGQFCWTEEYDGMTNQSILTYTRLMSMFGFTVRADAIIGSEEEGVTGCLLHYTKGDAEVIVMYFADSAFVDVFYKPGVNYTLLDGRQLAEAIGTN